MIKGLDRMLEDQILSLRRELAESIEDLTLEHDEETHVYTFKGKKILGASMIAREGKALPNFPQIEAAADHGHQYHEAAHVMNVSGKFAQHYSPTDNGYAGFLGWADSKGLELVASEQMVMHTAEMAYHKKHRTEFKTVHVCGTVDSIWMVTRPFVVPCGKESRGLNPGSLIVVDIKTGNLTKAACAQLGIYQWAIGGDSIACIFDVPKTADPFSVDQLIFDANAMHAGRIAMEHWFIKRGTQCANPTGVLIEEDAEPYKPRTFFEDEEDEWT